MADATTLGTIAAFGTVVLALLGFAWNSIHKSINRLEREVQKLRDRTRDTEHNVFQLMPLAPVVQAAAETRIQQLLEDDE